MSAETKTASEPRDYVMPPETLRQRMAADGRLWELAFAEGKRAACAHTRQTTAEGHCPDCGLGTLAQSEAPS